MSTTPVLPAVVTTIDDDGGQRISVFDADRAEICGAFKPVDRTFKDANANPVVPGKGRLLSCGAL
jgi:hypothetical protein